MVLDMLYQGAFAPAEKVVPKSSEYMEALTQINDLRRKLESQLDENGHELLEEYSSQVAFANGIENECHFKFGFASGINLMMDVSKLNIEEQ